MKKAIIILFLLSLPPLLWWFLPGSIVDGTDIIFPLEPILNLKRAFFAWDPINLTGSYQTAVQLNLSKFPVYLFLSIFDFLNFPLPWINKFWYFAYLFLPAVSYFLFMTEFFFKNSKKYSIGLIAAIFYIYNLYYVQQIIDQAITLSLIFAPLFLFLILKGIRTKRILLYSLIIGVLNFFYSPVNPNSYLVGFLVIIFFISGLSFKFLIQKKWKSLKSLTKIIILGTVFSCLTSAYFILPTFFYLRTNTENIQFQAADWLTGVSKYTSFFNVIRLLGAWDWFEKWNNEFYSPFAQIYTNNILFIVLSFIPPVLALAGFLISKNHWKYFFGILALVGIILSMGSHPPTGNIYTYLYNHLPLFWIFRSPWYKFGLFIVFAYSGLIALFVDNILKKYYSTKVLLTLVTLFIIIAHPIFLGTRFTKPEERHGNLAALDNIIPNYVFKTADWFNKQDGDERIIMIPQVAWESTAYTWKYGNLVPPLYTLLEKNPILYLPYSREGPGVDLIKLTKKSLYNPDSTPSAKYLKFLGVRYLVNQRDFSYFYFRAPENVELVKKYLNKQKEIKLVESFGDWDIYENQFYLPNIYSTEKIEKLNDLSQISKLDLKKKLAFTQGSKNFEDFGKDIKNQTEIKVDKVSSTFYNIKVETKTPFYLIFNQTFDKNWQIFNEDGDLSGNHFLVNSFANGYLIKKIGIYEIELKFLPQKYFNKGFNISLASIIGQIILITVLLLKRKMLQFARLFFNI